MYPLVFPLFSNIHIFDDMNVYYYPKQTILIIFDECKLNIQDIQFRKIVIFIKNNFTKTYFYIYN